MNKHVLACWLLVGLLSGWPPWSALAGEMGAADWAWLAAIHMPPQSGKPVVECEVTPEILDASLPNLQDLRVLADGTEEIGYVGRTHVGSTHSVPLDVKLYNRTFVPDRESGITVDFGSKVLKNRVRVTTPGTNFRRRVSVEGSDDGETWKTIREGAWLFRVQHADAHSTSYEGNEISFPENDFRYLRITVFNAEDDRGALEIKAVTAFRYVKVPAETVAVPVVSARTEEKKRVTRISLDLGYRNLPLDELKLDFSDANFFRVLSIWGRNQELRVVRRLVEDSPAHEKAVEEPWVRIAQASIHRFSSERATEEAVTLRLKGAKYRYLQVRIENRNDPPLHFTQATATRLIPRVEFSTARGNTYELLTGNPRASAPEYDVGHYITKLRRQGVVEAKVGKLVPNPRHKVKERTVPWSERHTEILWIALLAMALALGFLVYRLLVSTRKDEIEIAGDK